MATEFAQNESILSPTIACMLGMCMLNVPGFASPKLYRNSRLATLKTMLNRHDSLWIGADSSPSTQMYTCLAPWTEDSFIPFAFSKIKTFIPSLAGSQQ